MSRPGLDDATGGVHADSLLVELSPFSCSRLASWGCSWLNSVPIQSWIWPLVLLPYLLRHLYLLLRLALMIRRRHRLAPPFPRGLWGDIIAASPLSAAWAQTPQTSDPLHPALSAKPPMRCRTPWSSSTNSIASTGPIRQRRG
jgi:hypothetical protein